MDEVERLIAQLKSNDSDAKSDAAYRLGEIRSERAVHALIEALGDEKYIAREFAAGALRRILGILGSCMSVTHLEEAEKKIYEGSAALRKRCIDKTPLVNAQIQIAKLLRRIAEEKNELAPKRDLLLTDKPKPPKKGKGVYRTLQRVRNGFH